MVHHERRPALYSAQLGVTCHPQAGAEHRRLFSCCHGPRMGAADAAGRKAAASVLNDGLLLRGDTEMDREFLFCLLLDAHSKLVYIHTGRGYLDIKQLSRRRLCQRKMPLLVSLRGCEDCLPVRATEFNRYPACRFVCSANENATG